MGNKDSDEAGVHGRPCFYCSEMDGYFWMVPISSKVKKYKALYDEKKKRYKKYDGLRFGYVNGKHRAFQLKLILAWCVLHQDELMQNWESSKDGKPLNRMNPLV